MSKEAVEKIEQVSDAPSNTAEDRPTAGSLSDKDMEAVIGGTGFSLIRVGLARHPVVMCQYGKTPFVR